MSLKGPFGFAGGRLVGPEAYAVIDAVNVNKGGMASCHISVYATPPVDTPIEVPVLNENTKIMEMKQIINKDRGPAVEHYSCGEIDTRGKDAFIAAYEQLPLLDTRFKDMKSA